MNRWELVKGGSGWSGLALYLLHLRHEFGGAGLTQTGASRLVDDR